MLTTTAKLQMPKLMLTASTDIEKQKIEDRNRIVNNMSMFYGDDLTEYEGSIMDYRYLDDDEA